jgi:hypothetical protein
LDLRTTSIALILTQVLATIAAVGAAMHRRHFFPLVSRQLVLVFASSFGAIAVFTAQLWEFLSGWGLCPEDGTSVGEAWPQMVLFPTTITLYCFPYFARILRIAARTKLQEHMVAVRLAWDAVEDKAAVVPVLPEPARLVRFGLWLGPRPYRLLAVYAGSALITHILITVSLIMMAGGFDAAFRGYHPELLGPIIGLMLSLLLTCLGIAIAMRSIDDSTALVLRELKHTGLLWLLVMILAQVIPLAVPTIPMDFINFIGFMGTLYLSVVRPTLRTYGRGRGRGERSREARRLKRQQTIQARATKLRDRAAKAKSVAVVQVEAADGTPATTSRTSMIVKLENLATTTPGLDLIVSNAELTAGFAAHMARELDLGSLYLVQDEQAGVDNDQLWRRYCAPDATYPVAVEGADLQGAVADVTAGRAAPSTVMPRVVQATRERLEAGPVMRWHETDDFFELWVTMVRTDVGMDLEDDSFFSDSSSNPSEYGSLSSVTLTELEGDEGDDDEYSRMPGAPVTGGDGNYGATPPLAQGNGSNYSAAPAPALPPASSDYGDAPLPKPANVDASGYSKAPPPETVD